MNNILRLYFVAYNSIIDVDLQECLSLKENIKIIIELEKFKYDDFYVYDPIKKLFIDDSELLSNINLNSNYLLYIF